MRSIKFIARQGATKIRVLAIETAKFADQAYRTCWEINVPEVHGGFHVDLAEPVREFQPFGVEGIVGVEEVVAYAGGKIDVFNNHVPQGADGEVVAGGDGGFHDDDGLACPEPEVRTVV